MHATSTGQHRYIMPSRPTTRSWSSCSLNSTATPTCRSTSTSAKRRPCTTPSKSTTSKSPSCSSITAQTHPSRIKRGKRVPYPLSSMTCLHYAAKLGLKEIITLLLTAGVDMHLRDSNGFNASYWASMNKFTEILTLLPPPSHITVD